MAAAFPSTTIPPDLLVPFYYVEVDPSEAGSPQFNKRSLIVGQTFGTTDLDTLTLVGDEADAARLWGAGSMVHRMVRRYRERDPIGDLYVIAVGNAGGTASLGKFVFTGPATANGGVALYVGGQRSYVPIASGDTATDIRDAAVALIQSLANLPTSAAAGAGAGDCDLTAKDKGPLGDHIQLSYNMQQGEELPAGVGVTVTAMAGGATVPGVTNAIAAMGDQPFDYVCHPWAEDATTRTAFAAEIERRWLWNVKLYGHAFSAYVDTVALARTWSVAINDWHHSVFPLYNSPTPPWEFAAAAMGAIAPEASADPAVPFQTLELKGSGEQPMYAPLEADRFSFAEAQGMLEDGLATWLVNEQGVIELQRVVTQYQENAGGVKDDALQDYNTVATLTEVLRVLEARIRTDFPRHKLVEDESLVGSGQRILTPNTAKASIVVAYKSLADRGLVQNVAAFKQHVVVQVNATNKKRLDVLFPPALAQQARIFAVVARFRQSFSVAA